MNKTIRSAAVLLLLASLLAGCMGKFALTGKIYAWNKTVSPDRWVNEAVFVAFLIVPVYHLSLLADGIVFNSVQWWTGKNPVVDAGTQQRVLGDDGSEALLTLRADGSIDVALKSAVGEQMRLSLHREGDRVVMRDEQGLPIGLASL